jgi:PAS domain S-box-containing protein
LVLSVAVAKLLFDSAPVLACYVDRDHICGQCSQAFADWVGFGRENISGAHCKTIMGDHAYAVLGDMYDRVLRGETAHFDGTLRLEKTGICEIEAVFVPDTEESGTVRGFLMVVRGVTKQKSSDMALSNSQALLRSVLDTTPDAIITISEGGLIESFSQSAETLFGYMADEVMGKNIKMLMPAPYREEHDGYLAHYRETGERRIIGIGRQVTAQRKDGRTFPINLSVDEINISGQRQFTGIVHDISEDMKRQEQLRQAQKMEAVGQLTGGVAHDFNNLLTVIMGNLEMLEFALDGDKKQRRYVSQAMGAAELGAQLTGRMLAFARRQALKPAVIEPNKLIEDIAGLLSRTLGATIDVELKLDEDARRIFADPSQVQNVLLNLAINARDAMPNGGRLILETSNEFLDADYAADHSEVTAGPYVMFAVSDNGTGMSADAQRRAFEPFFTTKDAGKGSGLGLSMAYGFAKQSGGHLRLYSELGIGTTLSLYLPVADAEIDSSALPLDEGPEPRGEGETILVVEDDIRVREVTVLRLQSLGYNVLEAENGNAALSVIKSGVPIDLMFTDMIMPGGLLGGELAKETRRLRPEIKVLFTSGYTEQPGSREGKIEDGSLWLRKPYTRALLAQTIRQVLTET